MKFLLGYLEGSFFESNCHMKQNRRNKFTTGTSGANSLLMFLTYYLGAPILVKGLLRDSYLVFKACLREDIGYVVACNSVATF